MWNGMRFQEARKSYGFRTLDPVAWSWSAWAGIQCFRHFKGFFRQFGDFESRQIDGSFLGVLGYLALQARGKTRRKPFLSNWRFWKAPILTNFGGQPTCGAENRGFWKAAIFGVTVVGMSGGACWRRRFPAARRAANLGIGADFQSRRLKFAARLGVPPAPSILGIGRGFWRIHGLKIDGAGGKSPKAIFRCFSWIAVPGPPTGVDFGDRRRLL